MRKETIVIGYETSEQLDVEPAKYFVRVIKREKRACKACEEQRVQCAALPARIVDKSLASDRLIIDTVVSKYADHTPLYRQSAILERETGIELSRATMDGWVMRVGELLSPVVAAMGRELLQDDYIQADETPVGVQMHDGKLAGLKPDQTLLPNRFGSPMTRTAVQQRLQLHVQTAQLNCSSLRRRRTSPHTIRHATAMSLLQSGVAAPVIALCLGHEDPTTTHQYVEADLPMKEQALRSATTERKAYSI